MENETLRKSYLTAAVISTAIISAIILYTALVEIILSFGYRPPLARPAATAAKYLLYMIGVSPLLILKFIGRDGAVSGGEEALRRLAKNSAVRAAVCELPAAAGLVAFLLTGSRWDFYLLAVFSLGLEIHCFPRRGNWEERLRGFAGRPPDGRP